MTLEDHVGDIIRKSRVMFGLRAETVASAARLTDKEFDELEKTGHCSGSPDYSAIGQMLALDPAKLKSIAEGWLPVVPSLKLWRHLHQVSTSRMGMEVHAYAAWDERTGECAIFDTGFDAGPLLALIKANNLALKYACITHSHADHVAGLEDIIGMCPKTEVVGGSHLGISQSSKTKVRQLPLGSMTINCCPTPGHSPDGCSYIINGWPDSVPHVAIVGDALFAGSMGGTGPNGEHAKRKVREEILSLADDTLVCPGHGPLTTVGLEKGNNPFFPDNQ